jgi:hypothetical protein
MLDRTMTPFVPRSKQKKINQHPTPKNKTKINDAEKKAPTELPQRKNERKKTDTGIHKQKISFPKRLPPPTPLPVHVGALEIQ